jgi:hypothetical protein
LSDDGRLRFELLALARFFVSSTDRVQLDKIRLTTAAGWSGALWANKVIFASVAAVFCLLGGQTFRAPTSTGVFPSG